MALKKFKELYKIDLSKKTQKKPTFYKDKKTGKIKMASRDKHLDYIEWATVITLLYENGAESVTFGSYHNESGYPAFFNNGVNPFVKIWVEVDGNRYELYYPVIDGNKSEKSPDQLTIHKAQQRGMVKCVAINTGLGLSLWQKEEQSFDDLKIQGGSLNDKPQKAREQKTKPSLDIGSALYKSAAKKIKEGKTTFERIVSSCEVSPEAYIELKKISNEV